MSIGNAGETWDFLITIERQKLNYFGQVTRKRTSSMEMNIKGTIGQCNGTMKDRKSKDVMA